MKGSHEKKILFLAKIMKFQGGMSKFEEKTMFIHKKKSTHTTTNKNSVRKRAWWRQHV